MQLGAVANLEHGGAAQPIATDPKAEQRGQCLPLHSHCKSSSYLRTADALLNELAERIGTQVELHESAVVAAFERCCEQQHASRSELLSVQVDFGGLTRGKCDAVTAYRLKRALSGGLEPDISERAHAEGAHEIIVEDEGPSSSVFEAATNRLRQRHEALTSSFINI